MSELKAYRFVLATENSRLGGAVYTSKYVYAQEDVDKFVKDLTEGAMSMFREANRCRGLDTKSPLGKIANVAFKHWMSVERLEARIAEKDNEITGLRDECAELHNRIATLLSQIRIREECIDELKSEIEQYHNKEATKDGV